MRRSLALRPLLRRPKTGNVVTRKSDDASVGVFVDHFAAVASVKDVADVGVDDAVVDAVDVDGREWTFEAQNRWSFIAS